MDKQLEWISLQKFSDLLEKLHIEREKIKTHTKSKKTSRSLLTKSDREKILTKTDKKCHICGWKIIWKREADHIFSHSKWWSNDINNYLPAHPICNNYRRDYLSEEFQLILKMGVWMRTQIEKKTNIGKLVWKDFLKYEQSRIKRKKTSN